MGMFDDIRFEGEIPGEPKPKRPHFQTKDLECVLDHYVVKTDGSLWRSEWDSDARVWTAGQRVSFHGMLNFYTLEHIPGTGPRGCEDAIWFEYEAKFTDGMLQGIEVVDIHRTNFGKPPTPIYTRATQRTGV